MVARLRMRWSVIKLKEFILVAVVVGGPFSRGLRAPSLGKFFGLVFGRFGLLMPLLFNRYLALHLCGTSEAGG